uniref:DUF292 domain-containing protein n=1 Tax=Coccidioides posadasii RMSCC 3488 TaxID=454284 RepID=A0A0J6IL43_COCPO|nr:hypothetical protein CPAG_08991 [Coccidioides posadasii RMSCC 3488]
MPLPKQTTDLIFSLQALIYRIRQLIKERRGYSKTKARELAKLLKEGRDDFARIKTEDVIANDNLISALEIIELHCEQLHVRANILDHLAFGQKKKGKTLAVRRRGNHAGNHARSGRVAPSTIEGSSGGGGWGFWSIFGLGEGSRTQRQRSNTRDAQSVARPPTHEATVDDGVAEDIEVKDGAETAEDREPEVYIDLELDRAAAVIFYSYPRLPRDITGLPELRVKLIQRWGNEFASRAQDDDDLPVDLPEELVERLRVQKASPVLVEKYLKEIARSHGLRWHQDEDEDGDGEGGQTVEEDDQLPEFVQETDTQAPEKRGIEGPKGNMKGADAHSPGTKADAKPSPAQVAEAESTKIGGGIPEVDELAKRFAALKK